MPPLRRFVFSLPSKKNSLIQGRKYSPSFCLQPKYIRCIFELLNSSSNAVKYESASALVSLSSAPTAVKAAATCYINLVIKESDNNVKLIVLDRLIELRERHGTVLDDLVVDLLRVLASPDIEVRRKCLQIAMDMVSSKNVSDIITFLKKEMGKTHDQEYEKVQILTNLPSPKNTT